MSSKSSPIYIDYNATTPVDDEVCDEMYSVSKTHWRNPSSTYAEAERRLLHLSRKTLHKSLTSSTEGHLIFTSGATEAANTIIRSLAAKGRCRIISSVIEHPCIQRPLSELASQGKIDLKLVDVRSGAIDLQSLESLVILHRPHLVCIMLANNETGIIQPVKQAVSIVRSISPSTLVLCDVCQAIGKIFVDLNDLDVDFAIVAGHKFYGPRIGAYFCRKLIENPLILGGGQEFGQRSGTENLPCIYGLSRAAEYAVLDLDYNAEKMRTLRDLLESRLLELKNEKGECVVEDIIGRNQPRLPNTSMIRFVKSVDEIKGLRFSYGSACHGANCDRKNVRFSLGKMSCESDVIACVDLISKSFANTN